MPAVRGCRGVPIAFEWRENLPRGGGENRTRVCHFDVSKSPPRMAVGQRATSKTRDDEWARGEKEQKPRNKIQRTFL